MKLKPWMWKVLLVIATIAGVLIASLVSAISGPKHAAKVQSRYDNIANGILLHDDLNMKNASIARDRATKEVYDETKQAAIDRFMANFGHPPNLGSTDEHPSSTA